MRETVQETASRDRETIEIAVQGMDCANCVTTVRDAVCRLPGVSSAQVYLASQKAVVEFDPSSLDAKALRAAVERAGYTSPAPGDANPDHESRSPEGANGGGNKAQSLARRPLVLMSMVFTMVLLVVVAGEWLGLIDALSAAVPLWLGTLVVIALGYPVFRKVVQSALRGRIISHTLMASGALAALAIGEWVTATLVVAFMRVGDFAESSTAEQARSSLHDLATLAPQTARVVEGGEEMERPVSRVKAGEVVVVRPGESIPVDGLVISGQATVDQSTITGESMPIEVGPGSQVYAATIAKLGSLRVEATAAGNDTTFAKVIREVEQAEANRGETQRLADRFSAWYLPLVALIAVATYLIGRDLLAAVAVTVVACSCAFALATPVAMLASIGAGARRGLLIKGGKYIEELAQVDTLLIDKTGTVTTGTPAVREVVPVMGWSREEVLTLAASAEHDSEHPLARAVLTAASDAGVELLEASGFEALPGLGIRARVTGRLVELGSRQFFQTLPKELTSIGERLEADGNTLLFVVVDGQPAGLLAAADTLRPQVREALGAARSLGIGHIELLTGDNEGVARQIAGQLGVAYQANLLPTDKLSVVKRYQEEGRKIAMVGDGVNDAPALVQANVGIAMGAMGSDVALESAHVALMDDDWSRLPELFQIARRTMSIVRLNIGFTAVYNLVGISLAAFGLLPPIFAAALQSIPDLGIMGNSARLLRYRAPNLGSQDDARRTAVKAAST